jgi:hypothetical protein
MTYDGVSAEELVRQERIDKDLYNEHPSPDKALVGCKWVGRPERMFTNSPMPFTLAAWWKYPAQIAFLWTAE